MASVVFLERNNIMKSWKKLTALLLAGVLAGSAFTGCGKQSNDSSKPESSAAEESSVKETEAAAETTEATTTTVHVSPTETVSSTLGTELTDINAMLDKGSDTANNYKAKLDNFIQEGDVVQSFTFIVYSADGSSSLGDFKGGYGVSVKDGCASATDAGWYQAADFEQSQNSAYAEFTWNVPTEIQTEIDSTFREAYGLLQRANIEMGIHEVEEISFSVPVEDSIRIKTRSVMGTEIPLVEYKPQADEPTYAYYSTTQALDQARIAFEKVKDLTIRLSMIENSAYRLAANIKKTQKRANALKNITIPTYQALVRDISNALEEKEREEFTRLKVIKKRKTG